ncbi:MAG: hypothetical protein RLZZ401_2100 [Pseudomonadota bacterium]
MAANPVLSAPNGARISAALDQLDFMLSLDIYLNETSRHADVILPGLSPLEEMHFDVAFPQFAWRNAVRYSPAVLPAPPDHPPEWQQLLRLLGIVQGKGALVDVQALDDQLLADEVRKTAGPESDRILAALAHLSGPERLVELALRTGPYGDQFGQRPQGLTLDQVKAATGGIDLGSLQPRLPEILRTPSGKVELAPPLLINDLARVEAALAQAVAATPMQLIGRRQVRSGNSWMHNLPTLAKGPYRCTALVHPADAALLGLHDGGVAHIERQGHALLAQVELTDEIMPGVISLPHGWGHDLPGTQLRVAAVRPGVNLNALLDDQLRDPLSGNAVLNGLSVAVRPLG